MRRLCRAVATSAALFLISGLAGLATVPAHADSVDAARCDDVRNSYPAPDAPWVPRLSPRSGSTLDASDAAIPGAAGATLHVRTYLPAGATNPMPAIVWFTPYATGAGRFPYYEDGETVQGVFDCLVPFFALRGYALVVSDMRGSSGSSGCTDAGGPLDQQDGAAVVRWVASQPWSNGLVGARGLSYEGTGTYAAAIAAPPELKAIVALSPTNLYDVRFYGGVPFDHRPVYILPGDDVTTANLAYRHPALCPNNITPNTVDSGDMTPFYRDRDLTALAAHVHAAVLQTVGAPNWSAEGDTTWEFPKFWKSLDAAGVPRKAYIGPWPHGLPALPGHPDSTSWFWDELRWFDHWLKGNDTGIMAEPPVTVVTPDGSSRGLADYPDPASRPLTLLPAAGTLAKSATPGAASYAGTPDLPRPTVQDTPSERLRYETQPLPAPLVLSGIPHLRLRAALDAAATHLIAHVYAVAGDGSRTHLTWGFLDTRNRTGLDHSVDAVPGVAADYDITLVPVERTVAAGDRLELFVSSADACVGYELANEVPEKNEELEKAITVGRRLTRRCDSFGATSETNRVTVTVLEGTSATALVLPVRPARSTRSSHQR